MNTMNDYLRSGTNESVAQSDSIKGQGGAGGGAGGADGYVYSNCNEGCAQGVPSYATINTGQNDSSTVAAAAEKGAILSKLSSSGMAPNAKAL
jgi:hypothetical protein